ncbi:hypothetical protein HK405_000950, partial [Cladochytrium tenue]
MARESKHWVSRIWLILTNIPLLALGVIVLWAGAASYKVLQDNNYDGSTSEGISMLSKNVVLAVAIAGGFVMMTALAGCTGAIGRINPLLSFYVGALVIDLLLLLGFGIYFAINTNSNISAWSALSSSGWNSLSDLFKDYVQFTFSCCGFTQGFLVYSGDP